MKVTNAVMFHIGRCGSTVLSNMLNQNPAVQCEGEIFNPLMANFENKFIPNINDIIIDVKNRKDLPIQLFEIKFLEAQHLSLFNINLKEMLDILLSHGFNHFIILERKNYLKRMISHCVAQETKIYHIEKNSSAKLHQIYLNSQAIKVGTRIQSLLEWFEIFEQSYSELRFLTKNFPTLNLFYEEDVEKDVQKGYLKICSFFEIAPVNVQCPFIKTNPFSLSETLMNYHEIQELMNENNLQGMLNY
jgi:hypothetical protein